MHVKSEITKDFNVHASIAPNWLELLPFKQRGEGSNPSRSTIMGLWQSGLICTRLLICDDVGSIPTRPTKFSSHD